MRDRPLLGMFVISWLILFLELACIRWFPAHVLFLTFFTNTVLLASFIGMSIGCLLADRPGRLIDRTPFWLAIALLGGMGLSLVQNTLDQYLDVGSQANPDVVFFGTEHSSNRPVNFRVPVELVMAAFFLLNALVMVGPGQELGRAFNRIASRPTAYSVNLLGSLAGIVSFSVCSSLQLPPVVWFGVVALGLACFLSRPVDRRGAAPDPTAGPPAGWTPYLFLALAPLATVPTSGILATGPGRMQTYWSPYYRIDYSPGSGGIRTNLIGHQGMQSREQPAIESYSLPHLLRRDVTHADGTPAWPPFERVLIIGAGSGNDVSRAIQWCPPNVRIDAVEIDPVIQAIGAKNHLDRPYDDPRVTVHLNDGRNFLRQAPDAEYDLVVFALVDSLVLHSGYSNLRLESFLFTTESMRDVRRVLKPTGVAAIYNFFRQGWIAARLREVLRQQFGSDPVVLTDPPREEIRIDHYESDMFTVFFAGSAAVTDPLRESFARAGGWYWIPSGRALGPTVPARFAPEEPPPLPPPGETQPTGGWVRLRTATVDAVPPDLRLPTDDWPFLYSRSPTIPGLTWRGMAIVVVLSLGLWGALRGRTATDTRPRDTDLAIRSFFLGAGFMLVETKAVVHMALLFGSTWVVNSVVFGAVLLMALAGNLFAAWVRPKNLAPYYAGLFVALGLNLAIPLDAFLGLDRAAQIGGACLLAFAPVAFAGVIFATTFARSRNPDQVFGANVAGALVGGLAENASMVLGFRYLLAVAVGFYLLSSLLGGRQGESTER
jgi:spermidine synthase